MKIGVIGVGVVGGAVLKAFSSEFETIGFDIAGEYADPSNFERIIHDTELVFICVPSPTVDGKQDLTALRAVIESLCNWYYGGVVCIKCTVVPGTCEELRKTTPLRITHNPEFLTAAKPYEDFMAQCRVLIGGHPQDTSVVRRAYEKVLPYAECIEHPSTTATEITKYMRNVYLAMKVAFANEIYDICTHCGQEYNEILSLMLSQGGIEKGHWMVPGPDGKRGYSGMCFPKDQRALEQFTQEVGINAPLIAAIEYSNQRVRPHDAYCKEVDNG